jgi:Zinc knuckle
VQCGGTCKQFFHFEKCAKLTIEECDLIEKNRLVYVCPPCKKKHASIIFPRRDSVSDFEENAQNMPIEKLLEAQNELREDVRKMTKIIEEMQEKISVFDSVIARFEKVAENFEKPQEKSEQKPIRKQKVSYASIVQNNKPVVIVRPKNAEQLGAETINQIKSVFDPVANNINGVKSVSKGGVVIMCNDLESINRCREEISEKLGDEYEVNVSKQKKPLLKIWGLSDIIEKEELVQRLKKQNECVLESADLNIVTIKRNPRGVMCLLEADQQTHESLLAVGRVLIGWDSCRVYQHIDILRCFKCSQFGHIAANCRNQLCCAKCCGDHDGLDCDSDNVKCVNCVGANERLKLNLDVNHASFSLKCPSYQRKVRMLTKNNNQNQ